MTTAPSLPDEDVRALIERLTKLHKAAEPSLFRAVPALNDWPLVRQGVDGASVTYYAELYAMLPTLLTALTEATAECERYRLALTFYADDENYDSNGVLTHEEITGTDERRSGILDCGLVARAALT